MRSNYLRENLAAYETVFTRFVNKEYPLSNEVRTELKLIQNFMNLANSQVKRIEKKVLNQLQLKPVNAFNSNSRKQRSLRKRRKPKRIDRGVAI